MAAEISIPESYKTSAESEIRVTNYPESATQSVTPILIATLNRPSKLNAITGRMITDLITLFETVTVDDRVKAVIVTGAGKAFSAGIDLSMDTTKLKDEATGQMRDPGGTLALAMFNCSKPVIVAYNGLSVGIGMTSTLAAAIRIAPRTGAEFGFPFARIGLTMESCSSFFLPRMVGYSNATYLLTTGKRYPADSSVLSGVFAELVDTPKDVLPRAIALAEDIITNVSPMAAYLNRQLIWRNAGSAEGAHLVDSPLLYDMFAGSDHLAFKSSFFNKRKPEFNATLSKDAPRTYPWWKTLSVGVLPKARVEEIFIDGRYRIDYKIGQGGVGLVYAGTDTQLNDEVAIKLTHVNTDPGILKAGADT
ncbi:hypothetical protein ACQRIT_005860 [Beauveria bassiana]